MNGSSPGDRLQVLIQTPERIIWEGEADAVTSRNTLGSFDILPEHANIITLIEKAPIAVLTREGAREYAFGRALLHAAANRVTVFGDIMEPHPAEGSMEAKES